MIREDLVQPADLLSAPLGQNKSPRRRFELVVSLPQLLLGVVGLLVLAAGLAAVFQYSSLGARLVGERPEPLAARLEAIPPAPIQVESAPSEPVRSPPGAKTITIIDGSSGQRQEIVIPEAPEKKADLSEPVEVSRPTRNARPLPRPPR